MLIEADFRFVLELFEAGRALSQTSLEKDHFRPVAEWAALQALRRGRLDESGVPLRARLDPIFSDELGRPRLAAIRLAIVRLDRTEPDWVEELRPVDFADRVYAVLAQQADGKRQSVPEQAVRYVVNAYPAPPVLLESSGVREMPCPMPVGEASLDDLRLRTRSPTQELEGEIPVFIPEDVIREAREQADAAGEVETGGVLLGRLLRDPAQAELFLEVTCQIPARQAIAESTRLTFTPETWSEIEDTMALRRRPDEIMVGWWHSHPAHAWCHACPLERRSACSLTRPFLSEADRIFQASVFSRAHSLALVLVDRVVGESFAFEPALFGWCREGLRQRGFQLLRNESAPTSSGSRQREIPR